MGWRLGRIIRYPVKALSHQDLWEARLDCGQGVPGDRRFALAPGEGSRGGPAGDRAITLSRFPKLAQLSTDFDDESGILTIRRRGKVVAAADIRGLIGRRVMADFFAAFLGTPGLGVPQLIDRPLPRRLSLVGSGSLEEIERLVRHPVRPEDLRVNLMVVGTPARAELDWDWIRIGGARLKMAEPMDLPGPADRGPAVDSVLLAALGTAHLGIHAEVVEGGTVRIGDSVSAPPPAVPAEGPRLTR